MCKGSNKSTSTSAPSSAAQSMLSSAWNDASSAANSGYSYYPGQLVAGLSTAQQQGLTDLANAGSSNVANSYINSADQLATSAAQPISSSEISQYMNSYLSDVVGTTSAEINQNNAIQQNQLAADEEILLDQGITQPYSEPRERPWRTASFPRADTSTNASASDTDKHILPRWFHHVVIFNVTKD